jgi:hypothetical protein
MTNEELVVAVAATMDDTCDAVQLATALLRLARAVPRRYRATIAGLCDAWTRSFNTELSGEGTLPGYGHYRND